MLSHPKGVRSRSTFSCSVIRNVDKMLPSTSSAIDEKKCAKNKLKNIKYEDSNLTKRTARAIKEEEKLLKNNEIIRKEIKKEMDSEREDTEDKKVENKICTRYSFQKSGQKTTNNEKDVKVKRANTGLPVMSKKRADKTSVVQLTYPA